MTNPPRRTKRTAAKPKETGFNQRELFAVAKKLKILPTPDSETLSALANATDVQPRTRGSKKAGKIHEPVSQANAPEANPSRVSEITVKAPTSRVAKAFGPPDLLPGEDALAYDAIEAEFYEIIAPRNIVEEAWVRELSDGIWEERRLSLAKSVSIKLGRREGVEATVEAVYGPRGTMMGYGTPSGLRTSIEVMTGDVAATKAYNDCLQKVGLKPEEHSAAIYVARLEKQLRIQSFIDGLRRRRTALLRDVEHRRADMAKLLKVASERLLVPASLAEHAGRELVENDTKATCDLNITDLGAEVGDA